MNQLITVFRARDIITMEPMLPRATTVVVQDGIILSVGSWNEIEPWLRGKNYVINDHFRNHILMPGFIDTHVHPLLGGFVCASKILSPFGGDFPWGKITSLETPTEYHQALAAWIKENEQSSVLMTWGYHELWHGPLSRQDLDRLAPHTPLIVWHFSCHELYVNSLALERMNLPQSLPAGVNPEHVNREQGHFFETGAFFVGAFLKSLLHDDGGFQQGMNRFLAAAHAGGITTMADMATGLLYNAEDEATMLSTAYTNKPFRLVMTPNIKQFLGKNSSSDELLAKVARVMKLQFHDRVFFGKHIKLFADGAFFSQRMRMGPPGFLDGHCGAWIMQPDEFRQYAELFWRAGYQIHVHANGDEGIEMVLETVAALQTNHPRIDHRFTIEHCGYATEDQIRRCADLGIVVSAQVNYLYALADDYAEHVLGFDRAAHMCPVGSIVRHHIPLSLHSDFPLAPLKPLFLAHIAYTRMTKHGTIMAPQKCLTIDEALRALTVEAAYILRLEHMIGSIRAGKKADFTVLGHDPYALQDMSLKDVFIWGTVVDGIPYQTGLDYSA
jgi:predicted amidohydrolase YtcJ